MIKRNELNKTFARFNKIRLYHKFGFVNILPIEELQKKPNNYVQIQLNTDTHFNAIIMDIDDESALIEWLHAGLPVPTIQTLNKDNEKAHLIWLLNTPVSKRNKKAVKYYRAIVDSIKIVIGADIAYQNHQTKNFLNEEMFRVTYNDDAYDLDDFRGFIVNKSKEVNRMYYTDESTGSRHIDLFNALRSYGYSISTDNNLFEKLQKRADNINSCFDKPIKVKYILKSVYNFIEENKGNFRKKTSKPMRFKKIKFQDRESYDEEVKRRQKKSAQRTALIKRLKTSSKIKIAIDHLLRKKKKLTYSNISNITNLSLRTVKNHSKIVKLFIKNIHGAISSIKVIVLRAEERSTNPLKYFLPITSKKVLINNIEEKDPPDY